jgi:hypothetical protein
LSSFSHHHGNCFYHAAIFEEDETTLILAGAVLGFAAGLVQQGLETGAIKIPDIWSPIARKLRLGMFWTSAKKRLGQLAFKRRLRSWWTPNGSTNSVTTGQATMRAELNGNGTADDNGKLERTDEDQDSQHKP